MSYHKIYLASSWRNKDQPSLVNHLRRIGHSVYDFRNPNNGNTGFNWRDIDPNWATWSPIRFKECLMNPKARAGFQSDFDAMQRSDTCVLLLPSGRSAHLEAGWFAGQCKLLLTYMPVKQEPELMYKLGRLCTTIEELEWHLSR